MSVGSVTLYIDGAEAASSEGSVANDKVFYPDVAPDTDAIVGPTPAGAETFFQLRAADSPETATIRVDLPKGAVLRPTAEGAVEVVGPDGPVGALEPPAASDAQEQSVPVTYTVSGDTVTLRIQHHEAQYAYPILVDPVYDEFGVVDGGPFLDFPGWGFDTNRPDKFGWSVNFGGLLGLWITNAATTYSAGQSGGWWFSSDFGLPAASTTYIEAVEWQNVGYGSFAPGGTVPWLVLGIWNGAPSWATFQTFVTPPPADYAQELAAGNTSGKKVGAIIYAQQSGATYASMLAGVGGVVVYEDDPEAPSITGAPSPGFDLSRWLGRATSANVGIPASDPGLGVGGVHFTLPSGGSTDPTIIDQISCGDTHHRCPSSGSAGGALRGLDLPDGASEPVSAYAEDPVGHLSPLAATWSFKVDHTLPTLSAVGGALNPGTVQGKVAVLPEGTYRLQASASDQDPNHPTSGMTDLELQVDGKPFACWSWTSKPGCSQSGTGGDPTCNQSAGTGSCTAPVIFGFVDTSRYGSGEHTVSVVATDSAKNQKTQSWQVRFAPSATTDLGPGSLDLFTGNFSVTRDDVSIDNFGSTLTFSRTFNSRDPGAKVDGGILGPGWVASLPVDDAGSDFTSLQDTAPITNPDSSQGSGAVNVTEADGSIDTFTPSGNGYRSSVGLEDLTLSKTGTGVSAHFDLKDSQGDDTVFVHQTGDADAVFKPTEIDQPGASSSGQKNATTIAYEPGPSGSRVFAIFAPPPPGTNVVTTDRAALPQEPTGTRELILYYADTTNPASGDYANQLQRIDFVATGQAGAVTVARYQYDSQGRLRAEWDPRISSSVNDCGGPCQTLQEAYDYDSGDANGQNSHLVAVTPPGQQTWTMSYVDSGDGNPGRLKTVARTDPVLGQTAISTIAYGVPTSGSGAPYALSNTNVAAWGQAQVPTTATAVFPPDQVPTADPPSDYTHATIHYLDSVGRELNTATPGGHISMQEYDCAAGPFMNTNCHDNVADSLTPANRDRVLAGASATSLETINKYSADGVDLIDTLGPTHLAGPFANGNGSTAVQGRVHTTYAYDEGAPADGTLPNGVKGPFHLLTTKHSALQYQSNGQTTESTGQTTAYRYNGTSSDGVANSGWILHQPTQVVADARTGGANLTTTTIYDSATGNIMETRMPANPSGGDAHATKTIYYTPGANATDADCRNHPEWTNLPCKTMPAAQATSGLPTLPTTGPIHYNSLDEPVDSTETSGSAWRKTETQYDAAGRAFSSQVTTSSGTNDLPAVTTTYNASNGLSETTSTGNGSTAQRIKRRYDALGRLTGYKDADTADGQWTSTTAYDLDGRPTHVTDGKGSQDFTYDSTTGQLTHLDDSAAGAFSATYDADGNMSTETLPNGLQLQVTYDETDQVTERKYVKQTNCSSNCTWLDFKGLKNGYGQWVHMTGTLSNQDYSYDLAGRLTESRNTPAGGTCTTRTYSYNADSDRTSQKTFPPTGTGACSGSNGQNPTTVSHTYDEADRLTDSTDASHPSGDYDSYGRMNTVASKDAGGQPLQLSYYANDMTASMTQNGVTVNFQLDPNRRDRSIQNGPAGEIDHFSDDSDSPAWTGDTGSSGHFSRNVSGIDGDLIAIQDSVQGIRFQLVDLHGDVVATCSPDPNAQGPSTTPQFDEFGVPRSASGTSQRYGYLGAKRRPAYLSSGTMEMGVRAYVPQMGRFTSTDPVAGGSANDYDYANQDPVNGLDLNGTSAGCRRHCAGACRPSVELTVDNTNADSQDFTVTAKIRCPSRVRRIWIHSTFFQAVGKRPKWEQEDHDKTCFNASRCQIKFSLTAYFPCGGGTYDFYASVGGSWTDTNGKTHIIRAHNTKKLSGGYYYRCANFKPIAPYG